jgi:hypothetical protein
MFTSLKIGIRSREAAESTAWKKRAMAQLKEISQGVTDLQCSWHLDTLIFNWRIPTVEVDSALIARHRARAGAFVEGSEIVLQANAPWVEKAVAAA